jgi:hypothetical protein
MKDFVMDGTQETRPLFLYGTLLAPRLLSWLLTGDQNNELTLASHLQPATLFGFVRRAVRDKDYGALVKSCLTDLVQGLLFAPRDIDDRRKLYNFEGEQYRMENVVVINETGEKLDAIAFLWAGPECELTKTEWDIDEFMKDRLEDWLDLFDGMEFT